MASEYALFETPRSADTILQHLHVVVGFQDEDVRGARALDDQFRHVAEVGDKTDVTRGSVKQKANGVLEIGRASCRERVLPTV